MKPRLLSHLLGPLLLIIACCSKANENPRSEFNRQITFEEQQRTVYVAIAANESEREQGLMFRQELAGDQGMLFIYPDQARRGMWMKNTLLALDVVFLSGEGYIVALLKNLQPCRKDPCRIYDSKASARYMLELNAGFIDKHGLKVGQKVTLP
ncbi:DUF192 domain-containing protein [Methylomonas sp. 2BW1-5-20]|uniref:DUF192 domain-containing protein n=1 Tax=Methylomonas sp. 2BW1-5-20 TaxID=3376686 RepID=UPI004050C228